MASSQAQFSGQVLLHAARASAMLRGRASIHSRNCTIRNFASLAIARFLRSPAEAGVHFSTVSNAEEWIPAYAGKRY
jgi:hypothetical protein